jgi:two-component system chemotaxis sensor kinase CheA
MNKMDDDFLKRIRETFRIEAEEHLRILSAGLSEMEKKPPEKRAAELIENMFREVHSLKGAARSVDQKEIESVCHPFESLFAALKRKDIVLSPRLFDILLKAIDILTRLLSADGIVKTPAERQIQKDIINQLKKAAEESPSDTHGKEYPDFSGGPQTEEKVIVSETEKNEVSGVAESYEPAIAKVVRIPVSRLDPLLLRSEELLQTKISFDQRLNELKDVSVRVTGFKAQLSNYSIDVSETTKTIHDEYRDFAGNCLSEMENRLNELTHSIEKDQYAFNRLINDHLGEVKQILMLPVSSLVESFPAMVRDISHEQDKKVKFNITGVELEVDKRILEELKDPLLHLIRNSLDHGIGKPHERIKQNKPPSGTINLEFKARGSDMIEIILSDDGKGIDPENVLKAAVRSGVISAEAAENLTHDEIISLIFKSGVSTSSIITDISGRGLGLSIVSEKVEKLNGKVSVRTEKSKGTSFHILLPVTLATFRGILVKTGEYMFILPSVNVLRVLRTEPGEIKTVENHDTISFDKKVIPMVDLGNVLDLREPGNKTTELSPESSDQICIVVLTSGDDVVAFRVDDVLDERQVLVKSLGKLLARVKNISGATVLGSGNVVPVLYVPDLIKSSLSSQEKVRRPVTAGITPEKPTKILVAEDSVTARALLKNILETAGYQVTTSIDGADAFTKARMEGFDLIVSDVDMPRMNGFELTAKIRNDRKLGETPVVLVTALESREDRERGIEVGADAYIVKSSFDQTNLLGIIRKLI